MKDSYESHNIVSTFLYYFYVSVQYPPPVVPRHIVKSQIYCEVSGKKERFWQGPKSDDWEERTRLDDVS